MIHNRYGNNLDVILDLMLRFDPNQRPELKKLLEKMKELVLTDVPYFIFVFIYV